MDPITKAKHKNTLAKKRAKKWSPSVQTLKRKKGQHTWSLWVRKVQVVYLFKTEGVNYGRCEKCGWMVGLNGDHVIPKSNFRIILHDPLNGQVLCWDCNMAKGSAHKDWRIQGMRRFYAKVAALHWEQYGQKGIWQLNVVGRRWLRAKTQKLFIPGLAGTAGLRA